MNSFEASGRRSPLPALGMEIQRCNRRVDIQVVLPPAEPEKHSAARRAAFAEQREFPLRVREVMRAVGVHAISSTVGLKAVIPHAARHRPSLVAMSVLRDNAIRPACPVVGSRDHCFQMRAAGKKPGADPVVIPDVNLCERIFGCAIHVEGKRLADILRPHVVAPFPNILDAPFAPDPELPDHGAAADKNLLVFHSLDPWEKLGNESRAGSRDERVEESRLRGHKTDFLGRGHVEPRDRNLEPIVALQPRVEVERAFQQVAAGIIPDDFHRLEPAVVPCRQRAGGRIRKDEHPSAFLDHLDNETQVLLLARPIARTDHDPAVAEVISRREVHARQRAEILAAGPRARGGQFFPSVGTKIFLALGKCDPGKPCIPRRRAEFLDAVRAAAQVRVQPENPFVRGVLDRLLGGRNRLKPIHRLILRDQAERAGGFRAPAFCAEPFKKVREEPVAVGIVKKRSAPPPVISVADAERGMHRKNSDAPGSPFPNAAERGRARIGRDIFLPEHARLDRRLTGNDRFPILRMKFQRPDSGLPAVRKPEGFDPLRQRVIDVSGQQGRDFRRGRPLAGIRTVFVVKQLAQDLCSVWGEQPVEIFKKPRVVVVHKYQQPSAVFHEGVEQGRFVPQDGLSVFGGIGLGKSREKYEILRGEELRGDLLVVGLAHADPCIFQTLLVIRVHSESRFGSGTGCADAQDRTAAQPCGQGMRILAHGDLIARVRRAVAPGGNVMDSSFSSKSGASAG